MLFAGGGVETEFGTAAGDAGEEQRDDHRGDAERDEHQFDAHGSAQGAGGKNGASGRRDCARVGGRRGSR